MARKLWFSILIVTTIFMVSCSVVKTDDREQKIRSFLVSFQNHLSGTDQQVLEYFQVDQSRDAILSVVHILQNKESYISSKADFSQAALTFMKSEILITVPVTLLVQSAESNDSVSTQLVFFLKPTDQSFVISKLEGEDLYKSFMTLKNNNEWAIERQQALDNRLGWYEQAREMENRFDSVIWYCTYNDEKYFYVAAGEWENYYLDHDKKRKRNETAKMGLVNDKGEVVIPLEYEMIGTIGFSHPGIVEVSRDRKYGYFDVAMRRIIVEPNYDVIIPFDQGDYLAIVKNDTTFGWVDDAFEYYEGFPSPEVKQQIQAFKYLPSNLRLSGDTPGICEIPLQKQAGNGIIIPPSYLVTAGLFAPIESGICTTGVPINGWTDYKETKGSLLQTISEGINAVVTSISERYLEGREEFYDHSNIVFVNRMMDTLSVAQIAGSDISIRTIDSILLEVRTPHEWWFMEAGVCRENNLMDRTYFAIQTNGTVQKLKSHRLFPETEFVKLDSSYVTGVFYVYDDTQKADVATHVLSLLTLTSMRDEILASYGYTFPGREDVYRFSEDWYQPLHDDINQFRGSMTDIDRHNLDFLDRMIGEVQRGDAGPGI